MHSGGPGGNEEIRTELSEPSTGKGLFHFLFPDQQQFFSVGLRLDQFPFALAFTVQNILKCGETSGYAVHHACPAFIA